MDGLTLALMVIKFGYCGTININNTINTSRKKGVK